MFIKSSLELIKTNLYLKFNIKGSFFEKRVAEFTRLKDLYQHYKKSTREHGIVGFGAAYVKDLNQQRLVGVL
jgi:hypothetical protein